MLLLALPHLEVIVPHCTYKEKLSCIKFHVVLESIGDLNIVKGIDRVLDNISMYFHSTESKSIYSSENSSTSCHTTFKYNVCYYKFLKIAFNKMLFAHRSPAVLPATPIDPSPSSSTQTAPRQTITTNKPRKPCNCKNSQCLKL